MKLALVVIAAVAGFAAIVYGLGPWLVRPICRILLIPRYGFRTFGFERIPRRGPVVMIANHVTWLDGFFLLAILPRRFRALINRGFTGGPLLRPLVVRLGAIPVPFQGPKAQREAIQACRAALDRGEAVVLFPEGQLTRNGFVGPFYRGLEVILRGKPEVPVVPIYLDNLWGSLFSFHDGRAIGRRIRGLRRVIGVSAGAPIAGRVDLFRIRQGLLAAAVEPIARRLGRPDEPNTIDPALPALRHPEFGLLAASCPDFVAPGIRQDGGRAGSLGHALPGVSIEAIGADGAALPAETLGALEAVIAGRGDSRRPLGLTGSLDPDGFVRVEASATASE
ncbi:MAG: 1-acyl-sn-glycerol-3-phosphate acyltransferase [Isosphaeraceae bacterium]|nr:1-acyl-sn-glycerol-3-phosphate acyltransferase [Isosphaeraceae bacterium]